jgi:lysyl-tRNA synthetase class 2
MKPEVKQVAMSDDEKVVFNILKANSPMDLVALKAQSELSNKKWDKAIKGLTKHGVAKVSKTEDGLFVEVV